MLGYTLIRLLAALLEKRVLWQRFLDPDVMVELLFEPRDLWKGLFWRITPHPRGGQLVEVWLCLIRCVPIHIGWRVRNMPPIR